MYDHIVLLRFRGGLPILEKFLVTPHNLPGATVPGFLDLHQFNLREPIIDTDCSDCASLVLKLCGSFLVSIRKNVI